ncbi:MAG: DUF1501 domain-containing protein [Planctomycetaceae bacterium]|nr:DUF1501 domain-containing protein [Planctomycetaceae bacterium]
MSLFNTRRQFLANTSCGFGMLALNSMLADVARSAESSTSQSAFRSPNFPLAVKPTHHAPKAKRVIFLFMQGGPSQVDSFDYKPLLDKEDGKQFAFDDARVVANTGKKGTNQRIMKALWKFKQHGQTGRWISDLFPETARHADDLCVVRSLHTEGVAHGPSTLFLHCGSTNTIRPSMGSWITYGLGTENQNLPGFVSIAPSPGNGGPRNYGNAFLPAVFQGTAVGKAGFGADKALIRNLANGEYSREEQLRQLDLLRELNAEQLRAHPGDAELDAIINSYELAWRMQTNVPDVLDLSKESPDTLAMYGIDQPETEAYGKQCLMARRLCEQGVRYIQVTHGDASANPRWDQHSNMPKHAEHAKSVDKPIAGLLADLKQRGLLEDTIVWWGGEFGRTPYAQANGTGRDHNPGGFSMWLTGGGIKSGIAYGETDEFGHAAIVDKVHMHDLHATILWLLGIDHEKLTYRYAGRDFRLTDVHGHVVKGIMA